MEEYNIQEEPAKRPEMLTVLCVLSFINAVWNALSNFISFVFYDTFSSLMTQMRNGEGMFAEMAEQMGDSWEMMTEASALAFSVGKSYYFLEMALFIMSFVGVMMMWKLQKRGFHVYTIAQILMLIVTSVFVTSKVGGFPFGQIFWALLFVMMYYSHYKKVMR